MKRIRSESIPKIDKSLTKLKTLLELKNHMLNIFAKWNSNDIEVNMDAVNLPYFRFVEEAHEEQQKLGYSAFMSGFHQKNGHLYNNSIASWKYKMTS